MSYNILEAYQQQKQQQKPQSKPKPKKKRTNCFDCVFSRDYDSEFDNQIIEGRIYCRQWQITTKCGRARHCQFFEKNEEVNRA